MQERTSVHSKDILVVDDVAAIRSLLSDFLGNRGYRVETAASVDHARQLLGSARFSLVITNLQLDRTQAANGCDVVRDAKRSSPPLPVIVITGGAASEIVSRVSKLGADVFLSKPIGLDQLYRFVRELLPASA